MKYIYQLILLTILSSTGSIAQNFQKTIHIEGVDLNHYSIETNSNKEYVYAGTVFTEEENNDIHVLKLNSNGDIVWEVFLDQSFDDRALDVTLDSEDNIIVTGYTTPENNNQPRLFLAKFDTDGELLNSTTLDDFGAVGTNVIFSKETEDLIVGGLGIDQLLLPFSQNYSIVARFDSNLEYINHINIFDESGEYINSSINDIVEIPGGYFITGAIATELGRVVNGLTRFGTQGVLAMFLDQGLNVIENISFESTNARHTGVSAVYEKASDKIYLMSNNSIIHNPQIVYPFNVH